MTEPFSSLTRWRLCLGEFDFYIKYKKGEENKLSDAMYLFHTTGKTEVGDDDDIRSFHTTRLTQPAVP